MTIRRRVTIWTSVLVLGVGGLLLAGAYLAVRANFPTGEEQIVRELGSTLSRAPAPSDRAENEIPVQVPAPVARAQAEAARRGVSRTLLHFSLMLAGAALVSVAAGRLLSRRIVGPIAKIATTAHEIEEASLDRRIELAGPDDELRQLADTFDAMLDRLERSFDAQRQFVAHAAHELRTPLAVAQARAESALAGDGEDPRAALTSVRDAVIRAHGLQEALLALARSQSGAIEREIVDLAEVAQRAGEEVAMPAGVSLSLELEPAPVTGDLRLLVRLVANLLDNAGRYNLARGNVELHVGSDRSVRVVNTGPLVEDPESLLEPFARGETSRSRATGGAGLGLAIVSAIVEAHGGWLRVRAGENGGLDVVVTFPPPGDVTGL